MELALIMPMVSASWCLLAVLVGSRMLELNLRGRVAMTGDVALDGGCKPIRGLASKLTSAVVRGVANVVVPTPNAQAGQLVEDGAPVMVQPGVAGALSVLAARDVFDALALALDSTCPLPTPLSPACKDSTRLDPSPRPCCWSASSASPASDWGDGIVPLSLRAWYADCMRGAPRGRAMGVLARSSAEGDTLLLYEADVRLVPSHHEAFTLADALAGPVVTVDDQVSRSL